MGDERQKSLRILFFWLIAFMAIASRKLDRLTNAQLYAEDGTRFFYEAAVSGWASIFSPINAHLNVGARLIAITVRSLPWDYIPLAYNLAACGVLAAVVVRVLMAKIPPVAAWAGAIAVVVVPNAGEPLLNLCCLHFFTGVIFAVNLLEPPPKTRADGLRRGMEMGIAALSGPEVIIAAPLAVWRMWQWRKESKVIAFFSLFWPCAFVQLASIVMHPRGDLPHIGMGAWILVPIYTKQLFMSWHSSNEFQTGYTQTIAVVLACGLLCFRNPYRAQAFFLWLGALLYLLAAKSVSGGFPNAFGNGDRYAFVPFAFVLWSLGWLWAGSDRSLKKGLAGLLIVGATASGMAHWSSRSAVDYQWRVQVNEAKKGARDRFDFPGPGVMWSVNVPK